MRAFALPCPALLALALVGCYVGPGDGPAIDAGTEASGGTGEAGSTSGGASGATTGVTGDPGTTGASTGDDASSGSSGGATSDATADATTAATSDATSDATTAVTSDTTGDASSTGVDPTTSGTSTTTTTTTGDMTTGDSGVEPDDVCGRWTMDRQELSEGSWSGSVASCQAGDVAAPGRANALKLINLYRWLADLPAVADDPARNDKAQHCALMMQANGQLSHSPPMSWKCYSAQGAEAAGKSNIAGTAGVAAVDLYMADPGNATTMGHRRWILSNSLGPVGLGSASSYSCMWVIGGNGNGSNQYTAWPSPGDFPLQAMTASWAAVDQTGWTIQSNAIDLKGAQVTITMDGQAMPVKVTQLLANYGSSFAISMIPQGWTSQAGKTYTVEVSGVNPPISYDVHFVDCQ